MPPGNFDPTSGDVTSPHSEPETVPPMVEKLARAIEKASNQRPFGCYDFTSYPGNHAPHQVWSEYGPRERLLATDDAD